MAKLSRFIPPHLDKEKSNVENSENTTLFTLSCYEYILSGIVLSVGPPFRQAMSQNCGYHVTIIWDSANAFNIVPFVVTIVVGLLFSSYMLFDPALWLSNFMQLTEMALDFRIFILVLGIGYFAIAWVSEKYLLPKLAKVIGITKQQISNVPKSRKAYKLIQEKLRT